MPFDWALDDVGLAILTHCKRRYRAGLPTILPSHGGSPMRPDGLLNFDVDLEAFDSPYVLTLMAVRDPIAQIALGAAVRFASKAGGSRASVQVGAVIAEATRHRTVAQAMHIARDANYSPRAIVHAKIFARTMLQDDRDAARASMTALLNELIRSEETPAGMVDKLIALGYRSGLRPAGFTRVVLSIVGSSKVATASKLALIDGMMKLPYGLHHEIVSAVEIMPRASERPILLGRIHIVGARTPEPEAARSAAAAASANARPALLMRAGLLYPKVRHRAEWFVLETNQRRSRTATDFCIQLIQEGSTMKILQTFYQSLLNGSYTTSNGPEWLWV